MHNIPVFILLVVLLISWKREIVGGIVFILAGLAHIVLSLIRTPFEWYVLLGILIIVGHAFFIPFKRYTIFLRN